METNGLKLHSKDNVATALDAMGKGSKAVVSGDDGRTETIELLEDIPFAFKFATQDISPGAPIIKYGELIGVASVAIKAGSLVHIHNVEGTRGRGDVSPQGAKA
jgi:altronate dehydratase small subunit